METAVRSRYGQAIEALLRAGWTQRQIARQLGCSPGQVSRWRHDPGLDISYPYGQSLLQLAEDVGRGSSQWGQMIKELRMRGWTTVRISRALKINTDSVYQLEWYIDRVPSHAVGERLKELLTRG